MKGVRIFIFSFFLISLNNCATLNSVSMTGVPKERSDRIHASVEQTVVLYLNFSNSYVDHLSEKLRAQCSGGVVSGILTKTESICYLPLCFVYVSKITATGYCEK